jgi:hypothetical protein
MLLIIRCAHRFCDYHPESDAFCHHGVEKIGVSALQHLLQQVYRNLIEEKCSIRTQVPKYTAVLTLSIKNAISLESYFRLELRVFMIDEKNIK